MDQQPAKTATYEYISIEDAALRIVEATIERLKTTQKLVVALGENHHTTSHRLLAARVLEGLHARNIPLTFAIEEQEHVIPAFLRETAGIDISDIPPVIWDIIKNMDENGHTRAKTILANDDDPDKSPLEVAVKKGLPVIYADAARKKTDAFIAIDMADEKTAKIARTFYGDALDNVDLPAASISGAHIRNHFMLRSCTQTPGFLGDGPHVVVLQAGRSHILGSESDNSYDAMMARKENRPRPSMPYDESLHAIAATHHIPFIAACLSSPAGPMNGVESNWHEDTFYFDLPGNLDIPADSNPETSKAKKLAYMHESIGAIASFINLGRAMSASTKPAPAP
jgi:hypothetical protein